VTKPNLKGIKMSLLELFCHVDDFCQAYVPNWQRQQLQSGQRRRQRDGQLGLSEIMTIVIYFHQVRFRDFKTYYLGYVRRYLSGEFPQPGQLQPLCRTDGSGAGALKCLPAKLLWRLHGHRLH
jgi:hypothetical protein